MFVLWAFWCESERVVHFAFQDKAVAEDWRARYDDGNEFGHQCGPHRLVACGPTLEDERRALGCGSETIGQSMPALLGRCERMLPTGVECRAPLPCPNHGMEFAPIGKVGA